MVQIGALLNIDPGQTGEQIDGSFHTMSSCGMSICRISMDPSYGDSCFKRYDEAFDAAEKSDLQIVVTLNGDKAFCGEVIARYRSRKSLLAWDISGEGFRHRSALWKGIIDRADDGLDRDFVLSCDSSHEVIENGMSILPGVDLPGLPQRGVEAAISAMCDVTRSAAGKNPFWVTGIQGGSNLYIGKRCFSPEPYEIAQWVWTAVASGAKGIFMQSVNSRRKGAGAGEMSLLNMQGGMTGRSEAVKEIISCLRDNKDLFADARPLASPVTMIYTMETAKAEDTFHRDDLPQDEYEVRHRGGAMKDALAVYQVLMERGIHAEVCEISEYPWDADSKGKCVIFAGQLSVPEKYYQPLRLFVKGGGKVIIEGLSFCYNENLDSVFSSEFPLKDVFGGYVEEYNCRPGYYKLRIDGKKKMWVHLFNGIIRNEASGESLRILRNRYGRGSVVWVPSVIGMGAMKAGHHARISKFFAKELAPVVKDFPLLFRRRYTGISHHLMETAGGYITVTTSSKRHRRKVVFDTDLRVARPLFCNEVNFRRGKARNRKVKVHAGQTVVAFWKKK